MRGLLGICLLVVGCNGSDTADSDTDTTDTNTGPKTFEDFINVTEEVSGTPLDLTCHPGGEPWLTQQVDPATQTTASIGVLIKDFQSDAPVSGANTTVWFSDDVTTTPDVTAVSDSSGISTMDLKQCAPLAYETSTDPALDATKNTYEAHQMVDPTALADLDFNSVSTTTYRIIPAMLGLPVDEDKGIIAGTAFDCNEDPIEKAQVIVRNAAGEIPQSLIVKYFVDSFPTREQPYTSADGLWVAVNVPAGEWIVEMWAVRGGVLTLTGSTHVQSYPDSINISNVYTGFGDGVKYPQACLVAG